jgi:hypothetical protein
MDISSTFLAMTKLGEVDIVERAQGYPEVVK